MTASTALPLALIQLEVPPAHVAAKIGEQSQWFVEALALQPDEYVIVRPDLGESLPEFGAVSGAILSGSWAMVTDHAEWSERTAAWVRAAVDAKLPLLGVCYGHQLMAYALGGKVDDNPHGWERGLLPLVSAPAIQQDPLLAAFPAQFSAWLSHRQSVLVPPSNATVLAASASDGCQILRYSPQALSVQFHPEFDRRIMIACTPPGILDESQDVQGKDWARALIEAFWQQTRPLGAVQGA